MAYGDKSKQDDRQPIKVRRALWERITREAARRYRTATGQLELMTDVYDAVTRELGTDDPTVIAETLREWKRRAENPSCTPPEKKPHLPPALRGG